MKKYESFLLYILITILLFGCSHWGGDTPLGITGGSEEGYGQSGDLNSQNPFNNINPYLLGSWIRPGLHNYIILTFFLNGTYTLEYYYNNSLESRIKGTYHVSGNTLTMTINGNSDVATYMIRDDSLTIYAGDESVTYLRFTR